MSTEPVQQIYGKPEAYDLEHALPEPDIAFFIEIARRWKPSSIAEIACGNGRVTIPMAQAAKEWGGTVVGMELSQEMLTSARSKSGAEDVEWIEADVRTWRAPSSVDLVISPCASLSHLLTLDDQLAAWTHTFQNLKPGGHFVIAEGMANLPVLAESMQLPPRVALEIDADRSDLDSGCRLLRFRTTLYHAHRQSSKVHFIYDHFSNGESENPERFLSDYESHVYFPRELQLLFIASGFEVQSVLGDYGGRPLCHTSRQIVIIGRKPTT